MSVYELDWIAGGPPTVRLLSGAMGAERIGIMVAWITVIHQVGAAAAAYLGGALRSGSGTYFKGRDQRRTETHERSGDLGSRHDAGSK